MIFDLRKFWLGTAAFVLISGAVIAAVGAVFNAFIGMPLKRSGQLAPQMAPAQASGAPPPKALPLPSLARHTQATVVKPPEPEPEPQIIMPPVPQIIVPEPRSSRRGVLFR
jgi:hypothetical protein